MLVIFDSFLEPRGDGGRPAPLNQISVMVSSSARSIGSFSLICSRMSGRSFHMLPEQSLS